MKKLLSDRSSTFSVLTGERPLGPLPAQDVVLLWRQLGAPLRIGFRDLGAHVWSVPRFDRKYRSAPAMCDVRHRRGSASAVWSGCPKHTERSNSMQVTYRLQRSSGGIVGAVMVFLAALILGGAGGYLLKGATGASVSPATVQSIPATVSAPANQVTTDTSGEARRHFRLAN